MADDDKPDGVDEVRRVMSQAEDVDPTPWAEMSAVPGRAAEGSVRSGGAERPDHRNFAAEKAKRADPKARKSRFFTATDLDGKEVPARNWMVPELIPSGTVTLLTGDGALASRCWRCNSPPPAPWASSWVGRKVAGGRVLFLSAEDDEDELHRRLADVLEAEGAGFADLDQLALRSLAGEDALLTALDARTGHQKATDLFRELDEYLTDLQPALVVLDTLADLFPRQ